MIILDTGPVVAMVNGRDQEHERCAALLARLPGPLLLPEPLLGEIGYLVGTRCGAQVEAALLEDIASGVIETVSLTLTDFARAAELVKTYANLPLGTADASVVAVAERFGATTVATLDVKHFSIVRPRHVPAFTLLP